MKNIWYIIDYKYLHLSPLRLFILSLHTAHAESWILIHTMHFNLHHELPYGYMDCFLLEDTLHVSYITWA